MPELSRFGGMIIYMQFLILINIINHMLMYIMVTMRQRSE